MNQERHGCRTAFASASGACDLTQEAANAAWGTIGCAARRARSASHRVAEGCHHFEIEIVLGVDRASTNEATERGNDCQEIFSPYPIWRQVKIGSELFNV